MVHLPDKVKVGGMVYDVVLKDVVIVDHRDTYAGSITYFTNQIEISKDCNDQRKLETFLHEVLHAVLYEAGYTEHEEDMVNRVSKVLYQVVKDNQWHVGTEEVA